MDGTFVNAIAQLAQDAAGSSVVIDIGAGEPLSTTQLHRIPKETPPDLPDVLAVHSLTALVDYVTTNRDSLLLAECLVHIEGPTSVSLVSRLQPRAKRLKYLKADATDLTTAFFDEWHTTLEANIALQSLFDDTGQRADVLKILGGIAAQTEVKTEDDGRSQTVTARAGVKVLFGENLTIPNPVHLAPFRTFREVGQPVSPFLFRVDQDGRNGVRVAFFEADGGRWRLQAIGAIRAWLAGTLPDGLAVLG